MKKFMFFITALVLGGLTVSASTTNQPKQFDNTTTWSGYGNSFIFVENGIEFSIFPDGQFDFYMPSYISNVNVYVPGISISFNSGYDYNPYLQYDEFGAVIQIERVPIYYDYYGRVSKIGNVFINYNSFGYVTQVGGLFIHYNRFYKYSHYTGYINAYNRYYVYRPWHAYYRIPAYNHCVVYHTPYRQNYAPKRYAYSKPYANNYRRTTAVASRRGNTITRQSELATRPSYTNNSPRRNIENKQPSRSNNVSQTRDRSQVKSTRSNNQLESKSRKVSNDSKSRNVSNKNSTRTNNQIAFQTRKQSNNVKTTRSNVKNNDIKKPNSNEYRKYNKGNKEIASNTRSKR
ncbi:hypothetical protein [Formosa maritima]|uniref:DUF3300 domain-containing protein n=1 Tax=Formosa maritima TaxID=2592046 RepID=A0A5D0GJC2_9FLAO|nr:hypothetical protein [Formosa maritima]TYA59098.1 hypothetical protein FVF61_02810 [Formosa maritima]